MAMVDWTSQPSAGMRTRPGDVTEPPKIDRGRPQVDVAARPEIEPAAIKHVPGGAPANDEQEDVRPSSAQFVGDPREGVEALPGRRVGEYHVIRPAPLGPDDSPARQGREAPCRQCRGRRGRSLRRTGSGRSRRRRGRRSVGLARSSRSLESRWSRPACALLQGLGGEPRGGGGGPVADQDVGSNRSRRASSRSSNARLSTSSGSCRRTLGPWSMVTATPPTVSRSSEGRWSQNPLSRDSGSGGGSFQRPIPAQQARRPGRPLARCPGWPGRRPGRRPLDVPSPRAVRGGRPTPHRHRSGNRPE